METNSISVLLMDDEPTSPIIQATVQILKEEGFEVDLVETMSQAVESYYQRFYDVFVLDIDMSHRPDDQEGDGIKVLKRFISLHNQTRVIIFSGAGTVPHWFEAANAHCFAYVAKDESDSIDLLSAHIRSAVETRRKSRSVLRKEKYPRKALLYCRDELLKERAGSIIKKGLGDQWKVVPFDSLETTVEVLSKPSDFGIVVLLQDIFSTDPTVQENLRKILSIGLKPHVIVGCQGKDEYRPSILYIANLHPFRMINLLHDRWMDQLQEALKSAHSWYGRNEIFQADMEALRRVQITLPPEAMSHWEDFSSQEMEEAYDNYYSEDKPTEQEG